MSEPRGIVIHVKGFSGPGVEGLTPGYNLHNENGAMAVGRDGIFLQWGFSAPPSQMTEAGRNFFLNCVCYISKFKGTAPKAVETPSQPQAPGKSRAGKRRGR